jgi:enterochelin esterase-like enzyme
VISAAGVIQGISIESEAVGRVMDVQVVLPPDYDTGTRPAYPVLYFLHPWGLSPRYIIDKLRIHKHAWGGEADGTLPPMVIVMPTGFRSFFLNAADPPGRDWSAIVQAHTEFFRDALEQYGRYGDYLLGEVMPTVESEFNVRRDRAGRAIGGISMGGAAAAVHAFRDPGMFCAVGIHSPALFEGVPGSAGPPWIFGLTRDSVAARNPADVARRMDPADQPRIWLDTGDQDPMRAAVAHLHRALDEAGAAHTYAVEPGGHGKTYWEPRMSRYLAFYAQEWT